MAHSKAVKTIELLFCIIFLAVLVIPLVQAPPKTEEGAEFFASGYVISYPLVDFHKQNTQLRLAFHVFNISDGMIVNNLTANCSGYLYDMDGMILFEDEVPGHHDHFRLDIEPGNFSITGRYGLDLHCNSSDYGGFIEQAFEVTRDGNENHPEYAIALIIGMVGIILAFILIAFLVNKKGVSIFLVIVAIMFIISMLAISIRLIKGESGVGIMQADYRAMMWVFYATVLFALVYFIVKALLALADYKKSKIIEKQRREED